MIDDKRIVAQKTAGVNRFLRVIFLDGLWTDFLQCTKMDKRSKTGTTTVIQSNPSDASASDSCGRIQREESVHFISRLKEVIGTEAVASFARRSGVGEGTIRNVLDGAWPRTDNLISLANAGGVLVDWLATGRPPKTRADLNAMGRQAAEGRAAYDLPPLDRARLHMALVMADDAVRLITEPITPERRADLVLTFYDRLGASNDKP